MLGLNEGGENVVGWILVKAYLKLLMILTSILGARQI
jgi:hypothetical protein